jgi:hypothetical protein
MVHGVCPAEEADTTEVDACDHIGHTASNWFRQAPMEGISVTNDEPEKPCLSGIWCRPEYYWDSACQLAFQIMNQVSLPTQYSSNNLADVIMNFESEWLYITNISKGSTDSP